MESSWSFTNSKVWISYDWPSPRWEINQDPNDRNPVTSNICISGALVVVGGKTHDTDGDSLDIDGSSDKVARTVEIYDEQLHNFRIARSSDQLSQNNVLDKTLLRLTSVNYYGVLFPKQWCNLWAECDNQSLILRKLNESFLRIILVKSDLSAKRINLRLYQIWFCNSFAPPIMCHTRFNKPDVCVSVVCFTTLNSGTKLVGFCQLKYSYQIWL